MIRWSAILGDGNSTMRTRVSPQVSLRRRHFSLLAADSDILAVNLFAVVEDDDDVYVFRMKVWPRGEGHVGPPNCEAGRRGRDTT